MRRFEQSIEAVGALTDDLRRRMYLFIRSRRRPVGRDEAAEAVGISRKLAAFHLDKLVDKGLLHADYTRLSGRSGPGAGRSSKIYYPVEAEVAVAIPARHYDVVGKILIDALEHPVRGGTARDSVARAASNEGVALGKQARRHRRVRSVATEKVLSTAADLLYDRGYEPYRDDQGGLRLRNCPFHALAQTSVELVCGMNQAYIGGLLEGLGSDAFEAVLDPQPGECCVRLQPRGDAA